MFKLADAPTPAEVESLFPVTSQTSPSDKLCLLGAKPTSDQLEGN